MRHIVQSITESPVLLYLCFIFPVVRCEILLISVMGDNETM